MSSNSSMSVSLPPCAATQSRLHAHTSPSPNPILPKKATGLPQSFSGDLAGNNAALQPKSTQLQGERPRLAESLKSIHRQATGEELGFDWSGREYGVGLLLKAGAMGYPQVVGVKQGSAAEAGGVRLFGLVGAVDAAIGFFAITTTITITITITIMTIIIIA